VAKFPEPPRKAALQALGPRIATLRAGSLLWQVYFRGGTHPTPWSDLRAFGPTDARFDHHLPPPRVQARAILYAAKAGPTCLAEVYQATRTIDRHDREPWLVGFRTSRDLLLHDLTGAWVTQAGASTAIHSGARARSRRWSAALYSAFPGIEGLVYCSSMDANRQAFVLYERSADAMPRAPELHRALADPALASLLDAAAIRFGYAVV